MQSAGGVGGGGAQPAAGGGSRLTDDGVDVATERGEKAEQAEQGTLPEIAPKQSGGVGLGQAEQPPRPASARVMRRGRTMASIRATGSAFTMRASASGRPRSAKTLALPGSMAASDTVMGRASSMVFAAMALGGL